MCLLAASCVGPVIKKAPYTFETLDRLSDEQWAKHRNDDEYVRFSTDWLLFNNANRIDQKGDCYSLGGATEDLILVQNEQGVIQYVVPEHENEKTRCFQAVFLEQKYPTPPFAPFYHYMRMQ